MSSKRQQIEELHEELDELRETTEKLKAEFGLDDEDEVDKENVEVPAAGRTNWEADRGDSIEPSTDSSSGETYTEEVPLQGGDTENPEMVTVERTMQRQTYEDIEEARAEMWGRMVEDDRERKRERQERMNERETQSHERNPYTLDDDEVDDAPDVPAGGRSNWEARQEDDDR